MSRRGPKEIVNHKSPKVGIKVGEFSRESSSENLPLYQTARYERNFRGIIDP
jgi:hypothetical protein